MIAAALAAIVALSTAPLQPDARRAVERAQTLVTEGQLDAARAQLAKAAALQEHPAIVYARAQVERLDGDCAAAIDYYETFIMLGPPAADMTEARHFISECEQTLQSQASAPSPHLSRDHDTTSPPLPAKRSDTVHAPWWSDRWGVALLGAGSLMAATGASLLVAAATTRPAPSAAPNEGQYGGAVRRTMGLERAGAVVLPIGGTLLVGAVVRYLIVRRRTHADMASRQRRQPW